MNKRQLLALGVPTDCVPLAIKAIQEAAAAGEWSKKRGKEFFAGVLSDPAQHVNAPYVAKLAEALIADAKMQGIRRQPIPYKVWGEKFIDQGSHEQMKVACSLPNAVAGALMPDAHIGYGLPIGGVLALEGAVCPYAVGVDIACRMKMSILDLSPQNLLTEGRSELFRIAIEKGTVFGAGREHARRKNHDVMDRDWTVTRITRENKDKAWAQLGTSGSGNHFVEFGILHLKEDFQGLNQGEYVALLSHSGSRGVGASVCSTYTQIAQQRLPRKCEDLRHLAWLSLETNEGQEYWAAMNLMGEYAAANHDVIHRTVSELLGSQIIGGVENHHNFAWKEHHRGREVIVHRKGATPAGPGVLGVIPGSMASPAYVVRGRGNPESLHSASHGAGRVMSRTAAKSKYNFRAVQNDLAKKGVRVLSAGADEVPGVYKNIDEVMAAQQDLVETVARFDPRMVKMCGDNSRAED